MKKKIDEGAIVIGYVHPGTTHGEFAQTLSAACLDRRNNIRAVYAASNADHAVARNAVVAAFVDGIAEWLLWWDDDATADSDAPAQLVHQATKHGARQAHGYSFGYDPHSERVFGGAWEFMGGAGETDDPGWKPMEITGKNMWVDGVGCHFQLVHRSVYEKLGPDPHLNWGKHPETGKHMGQDLAFCRDVATAGFGKILYTPHVQTGHIKEWNISYSDYLRNHEKWGTE